MIFTVEDDHAALGLGRPQRCWRSLRIRARSRRWAASTSGWRVLALRQPMLLAGLLCAEVLNRDGFHAGPAGPVQQPGKRVPDLSVAVVSAGPSRLTQRSRRHDPSFTAESAPAWLAPRRPCRRRPGAALSSSAA